MITVTARSRSQPGGCDDHTHDHTHDHTRRAAAAAARALAEAFPHLPRKIRVTKVGRRWAWTCSRCAPPAAGSTYTLGDTLANAAEHMSRCKWHHRWVAAHLGATIGRTDTRHGQENTDPAAASSRGAPRPGRAAPGGRADHA